MEIYANIIGIALYAYFAFIIWGCVSYIDYWLQRKLYGTQPVQSVEYFPEVPDPRDTPCCSQLLHNAPQAIIDMAAGTTLTNRELAQIVGISASYPSYWKNGKKPAPVWLSAFTYTEAGWVRL